LKTALIVKIINRVAPSAARARLHFQALTFARFHPVGRQWVEMDDHKMYYDKRDLWPLLVRAGFRPSRLRLSYHKFGLNLFAIAGK